MLCPGFGQAVPTFWCWARSGCRRCRPRRSTGPWPGSTRRRLCHRHCSGAGAAGPLPWSSRHRAVAAGRGGLSTPTGGRRDPPHGASSVSAPLSAPLTRLEESCRLMMGDASCRESKGGCCGELGAHCGVWSPQQPPPAMEGDGGVFPSPGRPAAPPAAAPPCRATSPGALRPPSARCRHLWGGW